MPQRFSAGYHPRGRTLPCDCGLPRPRTLRCMWPRKVGRRGPASRAPRTRRLHHELWLRASSTCAAESRRPFCRGMMACESYERIKIENRRRSDSPASEPSPRAWRPCRPPRRGEDSGWCVLLHRCRHPSTCLLTPRYLSDLLHDAFALDLAPAGGIETAHAHNVRAHWELQGYQHTL